MTWVFNPLDWCIREPRMEPRMARMRGVRAPHRRTAHTAHPPVRGCAVGCAVGGATLGPPAQRCPASGGGGWSATNGEPQQRRRTTCSCPLTWGCHVIRRERPQPFPGTSTPTPAALRPPAGRSRPPTGRCDDGLSRHPQDPDRPLQGLVAARRRQPRQPDLRHPRPGPRLQAPPARRLAHGSWVDPQLGRQTFETWAREWWEGWSANPHHSPRTLQAAAARQRRYLRRLGPSDDGGRRGWLPRRLLGLGKRGGSPGRNDIQNDRGMTSGRETTAKGGRVWRSCC
jgi:hypothetical protein